MIIVGINAEIGKTKSYSLLVEIQKYRKKEILQNE